LTISGEAKKIQKEIIPHSRALDSEMQLVKDYEHDP